MRCKRRGGKATFLPIFKNELICHSGNKLHTLVLIINTNTVPAVNQPSIVYDYEQNLPQKHEEETSLLGPPLLRLGTYVYKK